MSGRPCDISNVLLDMVETVRPLALTQQRVVELGENSASLQVAVEEPALRQALSNLIEGALLRTHVGGKVEILSTRAPAGGSLVVIDDDGPDMRYMVNKTEPIFCCFLLPVFKSEGLTQFNMRIILLFNINLLHQCRRKCIR